MVIYYNGLLSLVSQFTRLLTNNSIYQRIRKKRNSIRQALIYSAKIGNDPILSRWIGLEFNFGKVMFDTIDL